MTEPKLDISAFVDQMAAIVNLPLQPEHHPGVVANFERIHTIAQMVMEFPLDEEVEVAPEFKP